MHEPEYLTLREAAAILGTSLRTVRRYADPKGRGPRLRTWKPGRRLTTRRAIEEFLTATTAEADGTCSPSALAICQSRGIL